MRCWRVDLRRKFSSYLNDELEPNEVKQIENHLLDCGLCRARLTKLRTGHRFARQLPRAVSPRDGWPELEASIEAEHSPSSNSIPAPARRGIVVQPGLAAAAIAIALLLFGFLLVFKLKAPPEQEGVLAFEALDYHRVSISRFEHNTEPHVMAEGYVSEVRIDHEDGDLVFKLVEDVQQSQPFIVCEILNPEKMAPPAVGSRVRVYGVSRYDNQENHNWYEVHPVLNIEVVHR